MENVLEWARPVLATTPIYWEHLVQALPAELLTRRPAAGEWSALECLQHILDSEEVFIARVGYFLAGRDSFPNFNPDREGTPLGAAPSPVEMAAHFQRLRAEGLRALDAVTPADLDRRARHEELGMVSLGEMVHNWAAHDLNHTVQAERAILQPFIPGAGPWQVYFQDHLVRQ
jgi:uncharacterized damage-inducible protein DinB